MSMHKLPPPTSDEPANGARSVPTFFYRQCDSCFRHLRVRVSEWGKQVVCPHCGAHFAASSSEVDGDASLDVEPTLARTNRLLAMEESAPASNDAWAQDATEELTSVDPGADADVQQRVWNFLTDRGVHGLEDVHIDLVGGTVILRGRVPSQSIRRLCVKCCLRVAGVHHAVDELSVERFDPSATSGERLT